MTAPSGFSNGVMCSNNVCFDGNRTAQVTTDGQLLIGSTVAPKIRVGSLTSSDASITITPGSGSIDLTAAGGGSVPWTNIAAGSAQMYPNNGYTADFGTLCTLTLPTTAAYGSIIEVAGKGAGGWLIAQNANQMIHVNGATSTTGVAGYLSSNDQFNGVKLLCSVADLEFTVLSHEGTLNLN